MKSRFRRSHYRQASGFTLAELLIALAILGVIATFTISKILAAQQNGQYNSAAKDTLGAVSGAFSSMKLQGLVSANTKAADIFNYLNYLQYDTTSTIDTLHGGGTATCAASTPCIRLHSGAMLRAVNAMPFGGTSSTNIVLFELDPDGLVTDGTTNGPGKALKFALYYDGRMTDRDNVLPNSNNNGSLYDPSSGHLPPWFQW